MSSYIDRRSDRLCIKINFSDVANTGVNRSTTNDILDITVGKFWLLRHR
jgi:hypothetical protein